MIDEFFTIEEFAKLLKVHPNTIRNGIKCGRIQAFKVGMGKKACYRIYRKEVERMAEADMSKVINRLIDERIANGQTSI